MANYVTNFVINDTEILIRDNDANNNINTLTPIITENTSNIANLSKSNYQLKNVVYFGDSYLQGYNPDGNVNGWSNQLNSLINPTWYYTLYGGGCGFSHTSASINKTFLELWNSNTMTDDEKTAVTEIIFIGGWNDIDQTTSNVTTAMHTLFTKMHSDCPNARIIFGLNPSIVPIYHSLRVAMINRASLYFYVDYLADAWKWNLLETSRFASDYVHPTQYGQNLIGYGIYHYLFGNRMIHNVSYYDLSDSTGFTTNLSINDNAVQMYCSGTSNASRSTTVGHFPSYFNKGFNQSSIFVNNVHDHTGVLGGTASYSGLISLIFGGTTYSQSIYVFQPTTQTYTADVFRLNLNTSIDAFF